MKELQTHLYNDLSSSSQLHAKTCLYLTLQYLTWITVIYCNCTTLTQYPRRAATLKPYTHRDKVDQQTRAEFSE